MEFDGHRYFKLQQTALSALGIWITPVTWIDWIKRIFCIFVLGLTIIVVAGPFLTENHDSNEMLNMIPNLMFALMFLVKYWSFCFNRENVRILMESIQNDWRKLVGKQEQKIIIEYYELGRLIGIVFLIFLGSSCVMVILCLFAPLIVNLVMPFNESWPLEIPIPVEYFIDKEKYYLLIVLHVDVALLVGSSSMASTELISIMCVLHSCAMFRVVSYQLKYTLELVAVNNGAQRRPIHVINEMLHKTVDIHAKTYQFLDLLRSTFAICYSLMLVMGILSFICNLYIFSKTLLLTSNHKETLNSFLDIASQLFHMFLVNYMGQAIVNHSSDIYFDSYNTNWYDAPPSTRRIILLIMRRARKGWEFTIIGIYAATVANFSMLCRMSLSYFMFFYSTHT